MYPPRGGLVHSGTCHGDEGSLVSVVTDGVVARAATRREGVRYAETISMGSGRFQRDTGGRR